MTEVGPAVPLTEKARRGLGKKGERSEELWLKYIEVLILLQGIEGDYVLCCYSIWTGLHTLPTSILPQFAGIDLSSLPQLLKAG